MKKIVLIGNVGSMIINFRQEFVKSLVGKGYQVFCFAYGYTEQEKQEISSWGAIPKAHFLNVKGMNPFKDLKAVLALAKELKEIQPDIVFSTFIKPVIFGTLAAKLAKAPKVIGMIEGLGNAFTLYKEGQSRKAKIIKAIQVILYRFSLPLLDKLIVLNPDDKKDLIDAYHIPVKHLTILGGIGVDLQKFVYSTPLVKPTVFIFIARLLKEKGILEYLEAAERVKSKYPESRFWILGSFDENNPFGLSKNSLERYVSQGIVEHFGYVNNVAEKIAQSSVFVLPSYREGVPRSTQEAMAIGRAVITTDVPGCRETVKDGVNGFLVQPYSSESVAEKMCYFIENPNEIIKMGVAGRKMAEQMFNIDEVNQRLIHILEN